MATKNLQAWRLAEQQHGLVTRAQLLALGFSPAAIRHRLKERRLHTVHHGVYAVGRLSLDRRGVWMAATLACGSDAALSHSSAAACLGIGREHGLEVSVPASRAPHRPGITIHRRAHAEVTSRNGIPITTCVRTLIDLATRWTRDELELAINRADKLGIADPESLRSALDGFGGRPGGALLRRVLDRHSFTLTDSQLERLLLPLAAQAGLSRPQTGVWLNDFKVDFFWPDLGLIVETDGLRYHRTAAQQARDRVRDQAHAAAGLTTLRFTHAQVRFEPAHVMHTLRAVAAKLPR
jgi:very-short-patch-repair endonuclease